jgi:hypothetical protein
MNPLLARLAVVRRRYRYVTIASGLAAVVAFALWSGILIAFVDWYVHLPRLLRACALVSILGGAGALFYQLLLYPLARRSDNLSLALRIEALFPELNDALASTVQFLEQPNSPASGDPRLRDKAVEKAMIQARSFDFHKILDYRFLNATLAALLLAGAAVWHFWHYENELTQTATLRIVDPFGIHPWTAIDVPNPTTRLAVGQPFRVIGAVDGILPGVVHVDVQAQNPFNGKFETRPEVMVPVKPKIGHRSATFTFALDVSSKPLTFRYRVSGNDGTFPPKQGHWQTVDVLQPPSFAMLDGEPSPHITLVAPEYSQLPSPLKLSPGVRHLDMIQGTEVLFRAAVDRPLKEAWIEVRPADATVRIASGVGLIACPNLLPQLSPAVAQGTFAWTVPVEMDATRKILSARFRPWLAGSYTLHLLDDNDLIRDYEADARVVVDPVPTAKLLRPTANGVYVPTAEIPFRMLAEDEIFAVKSVYLEVIRKNQDGTLIDTVPTRISLYEPGRLGDAMRAVTGSLVPFERIVPMQPKRIEMAMLWQLKKQYKIGDILSVQMCADDYCDVFTPRLPGRSTAIEMRIVSDDELAQQNENMMAELKKDLDGIRKIEAEAKDELDKLPKDQKPDAKVLDDLIEAGQKLKAAQERIGLKNDEGVREKLEKMQQSMKDNKVSNPEMQDQIRGLSQELERLVQEEFPRVEQQLQEARKQAAGVEQPKNDKNEKGDKNDKNEKNEKDKNDKADKNDKDAAKSPLDKAKETTKEIDKTLKDLTNSLNRWSDLADIKQKLREVVEDQKQVADATEKINKLGEKLREEGFDDAKVKQATEGDRKKLASEQAAVEKKANELLKQMREAKKQQDSIARSKSKEGEDEKEAQARRETAQDIAKKLGAAKGKADSENLNQEMQQAARNLDENKTNDAQQKQQNVDKTLKQMGKILDGKKDDDIDRLRKRVAKVGDVQDKLDEIGNKLEKQQNQKNGPNAKNDPKNDPKAERDKKADDLNKRAEELEQAARELQRLQEPKAARALEQAAEALRRGAKKVQAGEPADDEMREAQERIENAEADLDDLQQELAREQMVQIAERLKGLKERQDAAVERTKELHSKVVARRNWTRGLIQTLDADKQSQAGLAKETQTLEEKLKGAMVFEHILKKAGKSMDEAAEAMASRKELAKEHSAQEKLGKEEFDDEAKAQDKILKPQKLAAERLDRLMEALKNMPPQPRQPKQAKEEKKEGDPKKKEEEKKEQAMQQGGGDGIPPMAQIKALKGEQIEVRDRTREFAQLHPNVEKLNDDELRELRELTEEQGRLRQLFEQMTAPRDEKEGQP